MNWNALSRLFCSGIFLIILTNYTFAQDNHSDTAEELWASMDFVSIKKAIQLETKLTNQDLDLYMKFLELTFSEDRSCFFKKAEKGEITALTLQSYTDELVKKYLSAYNSFEKNKQAFARLQNENIYAPLAFNGPCENIGFESGTTAGWQGSIANACEQAAPCNVVNGFSTTRHEIMTTGMVDPYIPTLPVVAPGGNYSLRLENYVNGGNAALVRQTFLVTPANNIFTYQYAAVLEDPGDHRDLERPYFKVRMYDKNGNQINCATYTAIAKPPIQNFIKSVVPNPNYDPAEPRDGPNNNAFLNLYYRNWTTVTIPLLGYEGQNVTVEFIASDCSRGGHLGYAYIDASCSFLDKQMPPTICGSDENITLYGPNDFASYLWTGPGIVGSRTTQNIRVNKSGVYQLKLTPVADNPCPVTIQTTVPERCLPVPISASACETVKGSRIKNGLNLTTYNTAITAYNSLARVFEWHAALPATAANKIANPSSITVSNGSKYYAVINYTTAGSDTAELDFTIHSIPTLQFADINPVCKSNTAINISGVSPTGGVFAGQYINAAGRFTPTTAGTFPIKYTYTNTNGCVDSIQKSITVNPPPTITIGAAQTICATTATVSLTAAAANQTAVSWTGGNGTFSNNQNLTTTYTATSNEINSGSVNLSLTITGIAPCASVSDNVSLTFIPVPTANAGPDKDICIPNHSPIQLQGSSTHAASTVWSGGAGTFSNSNAANTTYQPTAAETAAGSVVLTLTSTGAVPCSQMKDNVELRFHQSPIADAGPDRMICTGTTLSLSTTLFPQTIYSWQSLQGIIISSTEIASVEADKDSSIVLKLKNQFGCTDADTMNIDAFKPPVFNLLGPYCFSNQLILNANAVITDPLLEKPIWNKDGEILTGEDKFSLTVTQQGRYTLYYKQGDCERSSVTDVFANPTLDMPDQQTECEGKSITLTSSNIPLATYSWQKDGQSIGTNSYTISTVIEKGISNYLVEVTDQHYCKAKDSIEVTGIPNPVLHLRDTSICKNKSLVLDGTPLNAAELTGYTTTYKWLHNTIELTKSKSNLIEVTNGGTYSLVASIGSCSNTASMNLSINPLPVLDLPAHKKICPESDKEIILDAGNHPRYIWQPTGETTKEISVGRGGIYSVTVFTNANCAASGSVEVKEICPPRLFVADAFSPNQDGTNDMFNVYGAHIGSYKLLIFNRWGEIIFESVDKDHFWNGIYKGEIMPIGVYPWTIVYEGDSHEYIGPYKLEGSVTIIK
jgi:gliding motility-associated-like protein